MDIKWPKLRFIRQQHIDLLAEDIVRSYIKLSFVVSFIGWWQLYQWIKPYWCLLKPLLEKLQ